MSNEQRYFDALHTIARKYQTAAQLRKRAGQYGLDFDEEIEMAYENIQSAAARAIKGRRRPKDAGALPKGTIGARSEGVRS